ncbi:MAG: alpha/beta hydrolase [Deltaproteobacteria bacterium]
MRGFFIVVAALLVMGVWRPEPAVAKQPAWLGVSLATVTPTTRLPKGLSLTSGALVVAVAPDGPAAKVDLRPGDVIQSINGRRTATAEALLTYLEELQVGETVTLMRARAGERTAPVSIVIASKPGSVQPKSAKPSTPSPPPKEAPKAHDEPHTAKEPYQPRAFRKMERKDSAAEPGSSELQAPEEKTRQIGDASGLPYTTIRVFYATDRNNTGSNDPKTIYGGDRSNVKYGMCDVSVPKDHRIGELEAPSYLRLEFTEDPAKHVILSRVVEKSGPDFYNEVQAKVAASKGRSAFIFVHGYNVNFSDAARRTAQMSYDLKFDGAPVFFSWPSQGSLLGYTVDEANIEYARSDLKTFIAEFARTSTAENIYLVAHSMGNRALTGAIADLFREAPDVKAKVKEVILAAPDIDADVFKRDIAPAISGQGQAVTLYASSNDWALIASKKFHGYARAGDTGQALTVVPGIATIDSSEVETDFLGHSYFAESTSIIADMFDILSGVTNPEDRRHLVPVEAQVGRYWKIPKISD